MTTISSMAQLETKTPFAAIEDAIKSFDVPFTIIRPNYFFQNDASLKDVLMGLGIYPMPLGTVGVSAVDVRDIAEATAIALTTPFRLLPVSCTTPAKPGSLICELDSDPSVAKARIRSRM